MTGEERRAPGQRAEGLGPIAYLAGNPDLRDGSPGVPVGSGPSGPFTAPFAKQQPLVEPFQLPQGLPIVSSHFGAVLMILLIGGLVLGSYLGCELHIRWRMGRAVQRRRKHRGLPPPAAPFYAGRLLSRNGHGRWLTETETKESKHE